MKARKRLVSLLVVLSLLIVAAPAASYAASPLDDPAVCYTPSSDYQSGDCILSASKVMIRRAAILRGSQAWSSITNKTLRTPATIFGLLLNSFTFEADGLAYKVGCGFFSGNGDEARIREFESLVRAHPEGVVVWGDNAASSGMHGVLLVDVKNGEPYAVDSTHNIGSQKKGVQKWSDTTMKNPSRVTKYWYIAEVGISKNTKKSTVSSGSAASTLSIKGHKVPSVLKQGKSFGVKGTVKSNYKITNVTVAIVDDAGNAVISKSAKPGAKSYKLSKLDSKIKFGKLGPGSYRYRISATDKLISVTLVDSPFSVTPKPAASPASSTLTIKSYKVPSAIRKGKSYSIKGTVKSNSKIKKVHVQVVDEAGNVKLSASAKPNAKSYSIKRLNKKVKFKKLARGTYYYRVSATDKVASKTLINSGFTVN